MSCEMMSQSEMSHQETTAELTRSRNTLLERVHLKNKHTHTHTHTHRRSNLGVTDLSSNLVTAGCMLMSSDLKFGVFEVGLYEVEIVSVLHAVHCGLQFKWALYLEYSHTLN